jgi:hypothetical protein
MRASGFALLSAILMMACGGRGPLVPTSVTVTNVPGEFVDPDFKQATGGPRVGTVPLRFRAGPAEQIAVGDVLRRTAEPSGLCIFDDRHACQRFTVAAMADGTLEADIVWGAQEIDIAPEQAGDVMIIAPDGGWVTSGGGSIENRSFMVVKAGLTYQVIAIAWEHTSVPFSLKTRLETN